MGGNTDGDEGMDFKAVFNSQFGSPARLRNGSRPSNAPR